MTLDANRMVTQMASELGSIARGIPYGRNYQSALSILEDWSGTIWLTGVGKSGHIARYGASMLRTIGKRAAFLHPTEAVHGELGAVRPNDPIIMISHSGDSDELVLLSSYLIENPVIFIGRYGGRLNELCDVNLPVCVEEPLPTVSVVLTVAWLDALVVALADNVERILQRSHPAGEIGRRLSDGAKNTHT